MSVTDFGVLLLAGVGAGLTGSVAGLASLISYPALLATGLPPLSANVTNTVALVFNSLGSISASRPELRGQGRRVRTLTPVVVAGGVTGAVLLLATPDGAFARVVPVLIGLASAAVLIKRPVAHPTAVLVAPRWLPAAVFAVGVYGGYFGAAAGVLLLSLLLVATADTLPRCNGMKNVLLGLANAVAAVFFVLFGTVHWAAVAPLAVGLFVGGSLGPAVVRRAPPDLLRGVIALAGLALAVHLAIDAYR